jgi:uncharacterized membrane protein YqaE (UPF0057 family)
MQLKTKFFSYNLAYLDHFLPPLGLFLQTKFFFLSLSQTHLFGQIERYSNSKIYQVPKTPPFSHNQNSPPQETKLCNKSILTKTNILLYYFQKFTSGWLIHVALALISPPLALSTKTGLSWPFNPIASPKMSIKSKKAMKA